MSEDQIHWLAMAILANLDDNEICQLQESIIKLDAILYGTEVYGIVCFDELKRAISMITDG